MPNQLAHEKSPYLLQHADNPVDWYPWSDSAFEKARQENKPVFLSIGYATCHWCHVMAHESFEDIDVANYLNKNFVSVKVDREERPDVDQIYMFVCQALTGRGGWPLTVFLTPDQKPFYAGTYFPKLSRMGMPGFLDVLAQINNVWRKEPNRVLQSCEAINQAVNQPVKDLGAPPDMDISVLNRAYDQLTTAFDPQQGGFSQAPKFPTPHHMTFLLRRHDRDKMPSALKMVEKTLQAMRHGGIFDQIGLGFHRYSVDEKWLVPHFEKMLYDQALLAMAYVEAYQVTGDQTYARVAREIFTYVIRDMTDPEGGFYSAEDADTLGREGLFYVWRPEEVQAVLGQEEAGLYCRFYDITSAGNFEEGDSIPNMPIPALEFARLSGISPTELESRLEAAREKLFAARDKRVHPLKDDKIITSWNGLMIAALAKGAQALGDKSYAAAAGRAADFIKKNLMTPDGGLRRRYRLGDAASPGYLDDYAFLAWGLIELYEATLEVGHLEEALAITQQMMDLFWDEAGGGLTLSGKNNETLISKVKDVYDGAVPSGNSVAALNLWRLGRMTGRVDLEETADKLTKIFAHQVAAHPMAYTQFLIALDAMLGPSCEVVLVGNLGDDTTRAMAEMIQRAWLPRKVFLHWDDRGQNRRLAELAPFLNSLQALNGRPTVYVCQGYACRNPITDLESLEKALTNLIC
ncbi:MAG: thioredoxin domain-containing protein [Deltaproteobacteria bacterium]|nr:thioredoxin domain-containing protein [Deltaproteobacteria bacterium]